tara:strand:+ start:1228 stop:1542 length:315 start_codon:yes stop_codon:yes gene_type:complete
MGLTMTIRLPWGQSGVEKKGSVTTGEEYAAITQNGRETLYTGTFLQSPCVNGHRTCWQGGRGLPRCKEIHFLYKKRREKRGKVLAASSIFTKTQQIFTSDFLRS